jgi:hypothetical protein
MRWNESILCIFLANLGQLSTWGPPRLLTVTHVCVLPEQGVVLPKLWFSILIILVQSPLLGHASKTIPPSYQPYHLLTLGGQCICFIPIYHPQKQWLEIQIFISTGNLVNLTQVNDLKKICVHILDVWPQ